MNNFNVYNDFKIKFFCTGTSSFKRKKKLWYSRKALETFEDLKDDMKKGQQKIKALIRRCFKDFHENML